MYDQGLSLVYTLAAHTTNVYRMNLLTNGYILTSDSSYYCKIWNPTNPTSWILISTFYCNWVYGAEYINSTTVATVTVDTKKIALWTMSTGINIFNISVTKPCYCLKLLSPSGTMLAVGGGPWLFFFNYRTGIEQSYWTGHTDTIYDLVLINSTRLASASLDKTIRIWDITVIADSRSSLMTLVGHTNYVWMIKLINSNTLASASNDSTIRLWDLSSGTLLQTLRNHTTDLQFGVDIYNNETIVSSSLDQTFKLWNACTGEVLYSTPTNHQNSAVVVLNRGASKFSKLGKNFSIFYLDKF